MAPKESAAPNKSAREEKPTIQARLNDFLRKNRVFFIVFFVILATLILIAAVWTIVDRSVSNSAAKALENVETSISEWSKMETGSESQSKSDAILAELDAVASKFKRRYAAQKSLVLSGRIYANRDDWASAEKKFLEAADFKSDSFLASFALQEAARSAEERQDIETAISLWKRVIDSYSDSTIGLPHAYFVLGTLYEESKQYAEASARYEKLIASYPDNDWTKLARNRIILLKSQGLLQ